MISDFDMTCSERLDIETTHSMVECVVLEVDLILSLLKMLPDE